MCIIISISYASPQGCPSKGHKSQAKQRPQSFDNRLECSIGLYIIYGGGVSNWVLWGSMGSNFRGVAGGQVYYGSGGEE